MLDAYFLGFLSGGAHCWQRTRSDITVMDRHREAHPSFTQTPPTEADLDLALKRVHFRLMAELYRDVRPIAKRRKWPTVRTHAVVVPITAARRWRELHEEPPEGLPEPAL